MCANRKRAEKQREISLSRRIDGEVFKRIRERAGLTQGQAGKKFGLSSGTEISKIEKGARELRLDQARDYLKALGSSELEFQWLRDLAFLEWGVPLGTNREVNAAEVREVFDRIRDRLESFNSSED